MSDDNHNHTVFEVDVLNDKGEPISKKPWHSVDRRADALPIAFIFVITSDREMLLGTIAEKHLIEKIYQGKLGVPSTTLIRHGEEPERAARRALVHDLAISSIKVNFLGKHFERFNDGARRLMHTFYCIHDNNLKMNEQVLASIRPIRRVELETLIKLNPDQFSPMFVTAYERHKRHIPF